MRRGLGALVLVAACGSAQPPIQHGQEDETARITQVLDDFHDAAADADEARYFGHLTDDAVFLGTDATERWSKAAFRAYAAPHFAAGRGWTFRSVRRAITIDGDVAWFDEDLESEHLGPTRGSGVLRRGADGRWRIAQYNLAFTIPNERVRALRCLLTDNRADGCARPEAPPEGASP